MIRRFLPWLGPMNSGLVIMIRIARKERRKQEALEDQRRIAKTKMREKKIRKLERLMENSAEKVKVGIGYEADSMWLTLCS